MLHKDNNENLLLQNQNSRRKAMGAAMTILLICLVQCVCQRQVAGPSLFDEIITAENYSNIWTQFIALVGQNECDCKFQHDMATTHTENTTPAPLQEFFGDCIVGNSL